MADAVQITANVQTVSTTTGVAVGGATVTSSLQQGATVTGAVTVGGKGDTGVAGATGVTGATGLQGPQGIQGVPGTSNVVDASTTAKGIIQLAGDLAGTAALPTVPGLTAKESTINKGAANGYAPLDATSKVPAANLPSYVDDVLEFANLAAFPAVGETGKIYVTLDTNKTYRWSGTVYIEIAVSAGGGTGITRSISTVTTTLTGAATASTDYVYFLNTGAVYTQPTAVSNTNQYTIKNITAASLSIASTGGQTFDGGPLVLQASASVNLISNSTNWIIT